MKKFIFYSCFAFYSFAWAGRESHGVLPGLGFQCASEDHEKMSVIFIIETGVVDRAKVLIAHQSPLEFVCVDDFNDKKMGIDRRVTVRCASAKNPKYLLQLEESLKDSRARLWRKTENRWRLQRTLSCD